MRLFAALDLPEEMRDRLAALQAGLPEGRLTTPENLHLTLAFFGEAGAREAEELHAALGRVKAAPFDLWIDGTGAFGGAKPRLLFAAARPNPALARLHEKVEQAGRQAGFPNPAERYRPHVTLKRLHPGEMSAARAARWLEATGAALIGPARIEDFVLFRSTLGHARPVYEPLARYALLG